MKLLCQAEKGLGAGCTYSARYYREKGQFHTSPRGRGPDFSSPRQRRLPCTTPALWNKVAGGRVYTIEGNTSSLPGVVGERPSCVRDKSYPLGASYIGGYGRPDYSPGPGLPGRMHRPADRPACSYTVVSGDSLSAIGSRLGVAWQTYRPGKRDHGAPSTIYPGQILVIPSEAGRQHELRAVQTVQWTGIGRNSRTTTAASGRRRPVSGPSGWASLPATGPLRTGSPNMMWQDQS